MSSESLGINTALRVLFAALTRPGIARARVATPDEDARGIDVVITLTDGRERGFQVKTSRGLAAKHRRRYPDVPVIIAGRAVSADALHAALDRIVAETTAT